MRRLLALLAFCLTCATAAQAATNISSCQNLSSAGETYLLTQNVSSSGTCMSVQASNVTLDCQGNKISFASGGSGHGVELSGSGGTTVRNCVFENGTTAITSTTWGSAAIFKSGDTSNNTIHNNTIRLDNQGADGKLWGINFRNMNGDSGNEIHSNSIDVLGYSRVYAIEYNSSSAGGLVVRNNTITISSTATGPYTDSIFISGPSNCLIHDNSITINAGSEQATGIRAWNIDNSKIYGNVFSDSGDHARMIHLDGGSNNNEVYDNQITMSGTTVDGPSAGVRIRYGSSNNVVRNNTIDTTACSGECYAMRLGGDGGNGIPRNNKIHNNTLKSASRTISIEEAYVDGAFWDNQIFAESGASWAILFAGWSENITNVSFSNDVIYDNAGNGQVVRFNDSPPMVTNAELCLMSKDGSALQDADVSDRSTNDWRITNGSCPNGTGTPPANTPPATVTNQRRTDTLSP